MRIVPEITARVIRARSGWSTGRRTVTEATTRLRMGE